VLTLAYGVMDDVLDSQAWRWRLGLHIGLFVILGYLIMLNAWIRERLVKLMDWMKREGPA
jgi:RsiW-degrading membrane proteinase PrsW (M82 family)